MSLQSLKDKLQRFVGEYTFNFAHEDDCACLFEEYGGEERMKTRYPALYQSFLNAREEALRRAASDEPVDGGGLILELSTLTAIPLQTGDGDNLYAELASTVSGWFIDKYKKVDSFEPASPWACITSKVKIRDIHSPYYLVNYSEILSLTNSCEYRVTSNPELIKDLNGKRYELILDVTGVDPGNKLIKKVQRSEQDVGKVAYPLIVDIKISDPAPQNEAHRITNDIIMLYGRVSQQPIFSTADYKDGDFLNNTFANGKVHLLMPLKGELIFNYDVTPLQLYDPGPSEALARSMVNYDYKSQEFIYRGDIKDDRELYKCLKECFHKEERLPNQKAKVTFDIKIPDAGRSDWDWHVDVEGVLNGEPKQLYLKGLFTYQAKDQISSIVEAQICIRSVSKDNLRDIGAQYYTYDPKNKNIIYIPPITIYWGCFGKNVEILLADGSAKPASQIKAGDEVLGFGGEILTVDNVYTGFDTSIYTIRTRKGGQIQLSGGHPLLCGDKKVRACRLAPGDYLTPADGGLDEVTAISVDYYNDTVYNFTLNGGDKGAYMIANGFYAGDMVMQNEKEPRPEQVCTPEEKMIIAEMTLHSREMNRAGRR